ncbi:hypothetical protein Barb6_00463 [Bacteroidales bacterium Barb6]|nr:hypothetical protein Barb6_01031 [Bacteroidales bacterium Barb6]OAV73206.1 hypothetical protein Barb6_00463 [Bacteroidales bacterium Barb6]
MPVEIDIYRLVAVVYSPADAIDFIGKSNGSILQGRVAFHRKRVGILGRNAVARRICPLRKMMPLDGVSRQRHLRSVGKRFVFVAAYASQLQVVCACFDVYRIIIGGNRKSLPTVARRSVSDISVPFFRTFGDMNLAGSRHFGKSIGSNNGYRVARKRQGS